MLQEEEIRSLIGPADALREVRDAFAKLARGEATLPGVIGLDVRDHHGEVHVKGAYLHGSPYYSFKAASGFYDNPAKGLPVGAGMVLVFDAATGQLRALLFDGGYLTELRTGAAGALAAELLARERIGRAAIVGVGGQARYQLEALVGVRAPERVVAYGRNAARARAYADEMRDRLDVDVELAPTLREAVEGSELVVTTTPAREPIVEADWIGPGAHVTAVGSDLPEKQELDPAVIGKADKVVADHLKECLSKGEIHHAVAAGTLRPDDVYGELGELVAGAKPGRTREDEITVVDLTGVGVQDAAVTNAVVAAAAERGIGQTIEV